VAVQHRGHDQTSGEAAALSRVVRWLRQQSPQSPADASERASHGRHELFEGRAARPLARI
jgi:hypothetical protein